VDVDISLSRRAAQSSEGVVCCEYVADWVVKRLSECEPGSVAFTKSYRDDFSERNSIELSIAN